VTPMMKCVADVRRWSCLLVAAAGLICAGAVQAEEIVVSNYGVSANGMPYAVALEKGFFKAEGANVTGIITSAGGGTTLRNMLAGNAPYGEVNPNAVVAPSSRVPISRSSATTC
jgi:NitT/TauT family transport system substrate-binding protein